MNERTDHNRHPQALGGYRIERVLGEGGMGAVYLAHDERLGRAVALKTMRPEVAATPGAAERFLREARSTAQVDHDHVIPIWQVGEDAGIPFIAMPLLQGESLADRMAREPVSAPAVIVKVGREAAEGLAAAHAQGLIHRDIKPANIWLETRQRDASSGAINFRVKILDFGLARPVDDDTHLTATGGMLGTPAYMSPEQARGLPVDQRTDLFSLGVVLYRMATGTQPFAGKTIMALLTSLAVDQPAPPAALNPAIPAELSAFIMQLLAKDPAQRPASTREAAAALQSLAVSVDLGQTNATVAMPSLLPSVGGEAETAPVPALAAVAPPVRGRDDDATVAVSPRIGQRLDWRLATLGGVCAAVVLGALILDFNRPGRTVDARLRPGPGGREVHNDKTQAPNVLPDGDPGRKPAGAKLIVPPLDPDQAAAPPMPGELDRKAAEWVIRCNGKVTVLGNNGEQSATALEQLPQGPILVTSAQFNADNTVTNAGLEHLAGLTGLKSLYLFRTAVTAAGLARLKNLPSLTSLGLQGASLDDEALQFLTPHVGLEWLVLGSNPITDVGLVHLKGLTRLKLLSLEDTRITDAGLVHLSELTRLTSLVLGRTQVTGRGLDHLHKLASLYEVNLFGAPVTDDHLGHLHALPGLTHVNLHGTKITDSGFDQLIRLPRLRMLDLGNTAITDRGLEKLRKLPGLDCLQLIGAEGITDAGLRHLENLPTLRLAYLQQTKVTPTGVNKLKAALPGCTIEASFP